MDPIRATLDAAYIQGFLGLFGALVGALAVLLTIYFAAKNAVKQIKLEKVAESKRDQYIALTEAYTQYLVSSLTLSTKSNEVNESVNLNTNNSWNHHLAKYIELVGCINKVNLITTSEIRLELYKLEKELTSYQTSVSNYYFNNHSKNLSHDLEDRVFEFAKLLRSDLGVENNLEIEERLLRLRMD